MIPPITELSLGCAPLGTCTARSPTTTQVPRSMRRGKVGSVTSTPHRTTGSDCRSAAWEPLRRSPSRWPIRQSSACAWALARPNRSTTTSACACRSSRQRSGRSCERTDCCARMRPCPLMRLARPAHPRATRLPAPGSTERPASGLPRHRPPRTPPQVSAASELEANRPHVPAERVCPPICPEDAQ